MHYRLSSENCAQILIGDWRIDPVRNRIRRRGKTFVLQPRLMDLLLYLYAHRDRIVSRNELLEEIWPTPHVTPHALNNAISKLRQTLESDASAHSYIYTKRGFGYQLIASCSESVELKPKFQTLRRKLRQGGFGARPLRLAGVFCGAAASLAAILLAFSGSKYTTAIAFRGDASPLTQDLELEGWVVEIAEEPDD